MRLSALAVMFGLASAAAGVAQAQTRVPQGWPDSDGDVTANLNRQILPDGRRAFAPVEPPRREISSADRGLSPWAATTRDVWIEGEGHTDRLSLRTGGPLRRADGGPLPPGAFEAGAVEAEDYDLTYTRGWPSTLGYTESGLEVTLTPHAAIGVGSRGSVAEAGATVRIGRDLSQLVPEGSDAFGERARWYIYAAGSGRAVGYNFARDRDGEYARSGMSHDSGAFLGDAQLGVAMRRGAMQSSIGVVFREIEPGGLHAIDGVDTDVTEGMFAFQLSIKPE